MTGAFMNVLVAAGAGELVQPWGMVFGPDGNLYLASSTNVLRYNAQGQFLGVFVAVGSGALVRPSHQMFLRDPCAADTNGDGLVNIQDFLAYLQAFAVGCS